MPSSTALYPGTFDPITLGHMDIIRRAVSLTDKLIIAVAKDSSKTPFFSLDERVALVREEVASLPDANRIEVIGFEGLLVEFAKKQGASILVRGLRAASDFEYEFQMAAMNTKLSPEIQTVFLPAAEATHYIASRLVKEVVRLGGDVSGMVSPHIANTLKSRFSANGTQ